jgi:hypothetical protein
VEDAVPVKRVKDEIEAELVCGLLSSAGIECAYRPTDELDNAFEVFLEAGPHEVIVPRADLDAARELLAETESAGDELPA